MQSTPSWIGGRMNESCSPALAPYTYRVLGAGHRIYRGLGRVISSQSQYAPLTTARINTQDSFQIEGFIPLGSART